MSRRLPGGLWSPAMADPELSNWGHPGAAVADSWPALTLVVGWAIRSAVAREQWAEVGRMGFPIRSGLTLRSNRPIDSRRGARTLVDFHFGGKARRNLPSVPEAVVSSQLEVSDRSLDKHIGLLVLQGELDRTTTPSLAVTLKSAGREGSGSVWSSISPN